MDETLRDAIHTLAEKHGLDPKALEAAFASGDMPEELAKAMSAILGDVGLFSEALDKLDR